MTEDLLLMLLYILVPTLSPGGLENNQLLPDPALKLNKGLLLKQLLMFFGFRLYFRNSQFPLLLQPSFVTTSLTQSHPTYQDQAYGDKQLCVVRIPGTDQWADVLTKPLSTAKFLLMRSKLNVEVNPH